MDEIPDDGTRAWAPGIPGDVLKAATDAVMAPKVDGELFGVNYILPVARAIMAEREQCAKAADHFASASNARKARELTTQEVFEVKIFARLIAAAIRRGPTP